MDAPDTALKLTWPKNAGLKGDVTIGSQKVSEKDTSLDLGKAEGYFPVSGDLEIGTTKIAIKGGVVRSLDRGLTPRQGLQADRALLDGGSRGDREPLSALLLGATRKAIAGARLRARGFGRAALHGFDLRAPR